MGKKVSLMNKAWLDASRSICAQLGGEYELLPNLELGGFAVEPSNDDKC